MAEQSSESSAAISEIWANALKKSNISGITPQEHFAQELLAAHAEREKILSRKADLLDKLMDRSDFLTDHGYLFLRLKNNGILVPQLSKGNILLLEKVLQSES